MKGIYLLVPDDGDEKDDGTNIGISFHVLTVICLGQPMQLHVTIKVE